MRVVPVLLWAATSAAAMRGAVPGGGGSLHASRVSLSHVRASPLLASPDRSLEAIAANMSRTQRLMKEMPGLPAKLLSLSVLASVLGAGSTVVPEVFGWRIWTAGMSGFGGVGAALARKTWSGRQAAAAGVLAELLLAEGVTNVTQAQVDRVGSHMNVPPPLFSAQKEEVYAALLAQIVADAELQVSELAQLQHARRALRLKWATVSARHVRTGLALCNGRPAAALRSDADAWARVRKLAFLTDCVLADAPRTPTAAATGAAAGEGEGAPAPARAPDGARRERLVRSLRAIERRTTVATLVGRRVRAALATLDPPSDDELARARAPPSASALYTALGLSDEEGRALCLDASLPLYERALQAAIGRMSNSTGTQLERARKALRLDLSDTTDAHRAAYAQIARALVSSGKLDADDRQMLALIADTLSLREREAAPIVDGITSPLYAQVVSDALDRTLAEPTKAPLQLWGALAVRQTELSLTPAAADAVLGAEIGRRLRPIVDSLVDELDAGADARALEHARALLELARACARFVSAMRIELVGADDDVAGLSRAFVHGGAVQTGADDLVNRLKAALARLSTAAGADVLESTQLAQLGELLGLPADARESERAREGAEQLKRALERACADSSDDGFRAARSLEESLRLPGPLCDKARLDVFYEQVLGFAEADELSEARLDTLAELVAKLNLSRSQLQRLNEETAACEQLAKRARMQAMAADDRDAAKRIDRLRDVLVGRFSV